MATLARAASVAVTSATRRCVVPRAPAPSQRVQRHDRSTRLNAKRATEADERVIEEMKRDAEKGDMLDGGAADTLYKVFIVSVSVGLVVWLAFLGAPVIEGTLAAFPSAER
ncbi:hypothetical protein TSOC_002422 [Tetrabaena socialis]|uniref:Uncharacterized protein n=1 Tax=Tetrabaena socialis TaxID=47790 RepID=A0A2J8AE51_9CHLO|nr:hypothetical protein TSOC_002422 [Tetrabaena socialis]|eukprot:PNH10789.1 hypothetical protein TSOC_002422 [Tetrabaena socialis]